MTLEKVNLNFKKLTVSYQNENESFGKVYISPLKRGYATTLGNVFRRVLLSSMPGVSVIGMKIEGFEHEYQLIPGTIQDGVELISALKELRFKMDKNKEVITFRKKENGEYFAKDLELPDSVECLTPDVSLLTLTGDEEVSLKIYLEKGVGYKDAEEHEFDEEEVIKIDGLYSPIRKVSVKKEPYRVENDMNYERLILEIETDGSIAPQEAVIIASEILRTHFSFVDDMKEYVEEIDIIEQEKQKDREILEMRIEELNLSARAYNSLKNNGLDTVGDIIQLTRKQLGSLRQVGEVSRREIEEKINELGYKLRQE